MDSEDLKTTLGKTLETVNQLIQREAHSDRLNKECSDTAKKLEQLQESVNKAAERKAALESECSQVIDNAHRQAKEILAEAIAKDQAASQHLEDAKKIEQLASEKLAEAQKALSNYTAILDEVTAQREKLKAALAG